jgi:hypothetical protein
MARLQLEARPGAGVFGYSLFVDGVPVTMGESHRGEVRCEGRFGDGSSHALMYSFSGVPGTTLTLLVKGRGRTLCRVVAKRNGERGMRTAGRQLFDL